MKLIAYAYVGFVLLLILIADIPGWNFLLSGIRQLPNGDKWGHFILMALLALSVNWLCDFKTVKLGGKSLLIGTCCVVIFILLEETSQLWIPQRTFDLGDLLCDACGIAANHLVYRFTIFTKVSRRHSNVAWWHWVRK